MKLLKESIINGTKLKVIQGDITEEDTDAIVNAANSYLKHGGGVAGAIVKKGGKIIQEESNKIGHVPVGEAAVTGAGKLKSQYVIHAVGPVWGEGDEENKLRKTVTNALKRAEELKLSSISIPAISSGIFGFPKERATKVITEATLNFLRHSEYLKEIHFCNIDELTSRLFVRTLREMGL